MSKARDRDIELGSPVLRWVRRMVVSQREKLICGCGDWAETAKS